MIARTLCLLLLAGGLAAQNVRVTAAAGVGVTRLGGAAGAVSGGAHGDIVVVTAGVARGPLMVSGAWQRGAVDGGAVAGGWLIAETLVLGPVRAGGGLVYLGEPGGTGTRHWAGLGASVSGQFDLPATPLALDARLSLAPLGDLTGPVGLRLLSALDVGVARTAGPVAIRLGYGLTYGAADGFSAALERADLRAVFGF